MTSHGSVQLRLVLTCFAVALVLAGGTNLAAAWSPGEPRDTGENNDAAEKKEEPGKGKKKKNDEPKIKPYDEIITDKAVTEAGLFRTHRIDDKLFYEIPTGALGQDLLWVTQIAETTAGSSFAGMPVGNRVVRWEQRGDRVLLRDVRFGMRAETDDPIAMAVEASNLAPIVRAFDVKAYGEDKAPVIDVTELFTKDVAEFSARRALNAGGMDKARSFVEDVSAFPENIEVQVLASYAEGKPDRPTTPGRPAPRNDVPRTSGITALLHHSMVKLPDSPMKPRREDDRVGFFSVGFTDFGDDSQHEAERVRYITRWRLEKKKPGARMSEPVKPIVFYVGREVPAKWQPYVKAGIEDWLPAFEAAGFRNAIEGRYAPDPAEDPDWDPEDARISTIRWLPSSIENAFGPHVNDPRTGEILEADVRMFHNVQKLVRDWYFVQAAASDDRAQDLPMPDELVGELIRFVVAHEVGHSLGFPHNMKASSSYTVEQLRDPEWTRKNGTAPSIMDYARFNYVAQPGDGAALMPGVGPYDLFATEWGYRQFDEGTDEKAALEKIVARQIEEPMFRFGGPNPRVDSTQQTEDLGSDAVAATELGLRNLERIAGFVVAATSEPGEDYELLSNMYDRLLNQWAREMGHVANVVGGVRLDNLYYGDADRRFFPNDADYQRRAVEFLVQNALRTPALFTSPDVVLRLTGQGVADRLLGAQRGVVRSLVSEARIDRMAEHADGDGANAYAPADMLADLRVGVFEELAGTSVSIDLYRRNLQRAYVEHLGTFLAKPSADSDLPALARWELTAIADMLDEVRWKTGGVVGAHLADLAARIEDALDPEDEPSGGGTLKEPDE